MLDQSSRTIEDQDGTGVSNGAGKGLAPERSAVDVAELSMNIGNTPSGDVDVVARQVSNETTTNAALLDYPVRIILLEMKAGYHARVKLFPIEHPSCWVIGSRCDQIVGVAVKIAQSSGSQNLNGFSINAGQLSVSVSQDCEKIDVNVYIRTKGSLLRGGVQLPQGGSITIESPVDRATLIGVSSFGIALY